MRNVNQREQAGVILQHLGSSLAAVAAADCSAAVLQSPDLQ